MTTFCPRSIDFRLITSELLKTLNLGPPARNRSVRHLLTAYRAWYGDSPERRPWHKRVPIRKM